jgi:hypothetical protein
LRERAKEVAEELATKNPTDARTLEMMKQHYLREDDVRVVAATFGTTPEAYYKAEQRFRRRVRLAMGLLALAVVLFLFARRPRPVPVAIVPEASARDRATPIELEALQACDRQDWTTCLSGLDAAALIDPTVNNDVKVLSARKAAAEALVQPDEKTPESPAPKGPKAPSKRP